MGVGYSGTSSVSRKAEDMSCTAAGAGAGDVLAMRLTEEIARFEIRDPVLECGLGEDGAESRGWGQGQFHGGLDIGRVVSLTVWALGGLLSVTLLDKQLVTVRSIVGAGVSQASRLLS